MAQVIKKLGLSLPVFRLSALQKSLFLQVAFGVFLLFITSQISIPLRPVPITLQSMGALFIGMTYSPRRVASVFILWLGLGSIGLPFFAEYSSGVHIFWGPSAGYLVGMFCSAFLLSCLRLNGNFKTFTASLVLCVLGTVLVFCVGIAWLSVFTGFKQALVLGLFPFILPGFFKSMALALLLKVFDK